jgi:L-lactate dehydrogenase complex protein LldG
MTARDEVLDRIKRAIGPPKTLSVQREYRMSGDHPPGAPELIELLTGRLLDYKATVIHCDDTEGAIAAAIIEVLSQRAVDQVVVPTGVPDGWLPANRRRVDHPPLTVHQLDEAQGVLTGSVVTIAETGTIVLNGSPLCGRRAITLVPDLHICVVHASQVVHSVPEGIARLDPLKPLTFISGPSATVDIELQRVEGVHGPRQLVAVIAS